MSSGLHAAPIIFLQKDIYSCLETNLMYGTAQAPLWSSDGSLNTSPSPRRRRHLMKEVLQWHMLYDVMLNDIAAHAPPVRRARSVSAVNCLVCFAGCAVCSHFARGPARSEAVATEYVPRGHPFRISAGALRSRREANRVLALILRPRCTLGVYRGFTPCDPVW